ITLANAFEVADDVLRQGLQSISELIKIPAMVNLDFADVMAVMKDAGYAHMGVGTASGRDKAETAAQAAISSPLIETSMEGARGVIINITGSPDIGLEEVETASEIIAKAAHADANIIWGATLDDSLEDQIRVTVIATGANSEGVKRSSGKTDTGVGAGAGSGAGAASSSGLVSSSSAKKESKKNEDVSDDDDYYDIMSIFNRK
ncbi:MAG TPA: cell division protein FtsZ, partial [Ruminococcaceae bacterium]|nr:cell division protein FtsZ [Oscillospiraceae bacterium]